MQVKVIITTTQAKLQPTTEPSVADEMASVLGDEDEEAALRARIDQRVAEHFREVEAAQRLGIPWHGQATEPVVAPEGDQVST